MLGFGLDASAARAPPLIDCSTVYFCARSRSATRSAVAASRNAPTCTQYVPLPAGTFVAALFVAFAPVDAPRIALAVVVENAGFGARAAAPVARQVLDYYLLGKRVNQPAAVVPGDEGDD